MTHSAAAVPPCPTDFNAEEFFGRIHWHQRWQIFQGVFTPGLNTIGDMCDNLQLPSDLSGKRVLDIGAWNGCLSFECERRGAREVIALGPEDPTKTGFFKIRDAIGSTRTRYLEGSVYGLNPKKLGYFDVVLFCGVLYHLRYPLLGIDNIRRVCTGEVYIETFIIDNEVILKKGEAIERTPLSEAAPAMLSTPMWQFYQLGELGGTDSNWFGPNSLAVIQAFDSAGFSTTLTKAWGTRGAFRGRIKPGMPEFLAIESGEGIYYETLVQHLFDQQTRDSIGAVPGSRLPSKPHFWKKLRHLISRPS